MATPGTGDTLFSKDLFAGVNVCGASWPRGGGRVWGTSSGGGNGEMRRMGA